MSTLKLAMQNFRSSVKNYLALIISMSFTILILLNFQNVIYSDSFAVLGTRNKDYVDTIIQMICVVLGCFMFFFIWYSTNVFLTKRKKEIGIYVFMGLSNQKIGKLYMLESLMTGLAALVIGIGSGMLVSQLFQMILLAISDIAVEIKFRFDIKPVIITAVVYLAIYLIFVVKGYVSIVRSSVLDMVSASRQNEYVKQKNWILIVKAIAGTVVLAAGYYMALKKSGQEMLLAAVAAVVLVIAGVYLLFGGLIPLFFQGLKRKKTFLYKGQRTLWVNNLIFRIRKNYRTYAMTSVLMLCSVTALAAGFAIKIRYDNIVHFRNTYTFQLLTNQKGLGTTAEELIKKDNEIAYQSEITMLQLDEGLFEDQEFRTLRAILPYSQLKQLAKDTGLEFSLPEPGVDEEIDMENMPLLSLASADQNAVVKINGKEFRQIAQTEVPYLGYLQESVSYYVVNDRVYNELLPLGQQLYTYNYRISDIYNFRESLDELDTITSNTAENYTARVAIDPKDSEVEWMKVTYSVCIFMFMVFILASGCILFMKVYNDAFEEQERYRVLQKIGIGREMLGGAIARELSMTYAMPFVVMAVSSYFSVHALGNVMNTDLLAVNVVSVVVILLFSVLCYVLSVLVYRKLLNLDIKK
ncbi:MAG: ABC transporter permease [Hespellia sp.]|nr:ABC transporter permease [Hespellia sp.]